MKVRFYRNTHKDGIFREELRRSGVCFVAHLLEHKKGKSLGQIVALVARYDNQFPEEPRTGVAGVLEDLYRGIAATSIRVECLEKAPEKKR